MTQVGGSKNGVTYYLNDILPASVTDEKPQVSEKSFDPPVRVVISGTFLHDSLLPFFAATQKGVFTDFEKFELKIISLPYKNG